VQQRPLGTRTGRTVGAVGLGTWQLGADWGDVDEADALATLHAAVDAGVTLLDTADVYGDGRSEHLIGRLLRELSDRQRAALIVATKAGRRGPQEPGEFTLANLRAWTDRSRRELGVDRLDLLQLHCPPTPVYAMPAVYDALDTLVSEGALAAYGVSVETVAEGLAAIEHPGVATVQVILNAFRHKPTEELLPACAAAGVGVLARVPLASGLLSGRYDESTTFAAEDHRSYNRGGEAFDVGETFSGVDYATGLAAVRRLRPLVPQGMSMPELALRWVLAQPGVSAVIPGARSPEQAVANARAGDGQPLPADVLPGVRAVYDDLLREQIHPRW